MHLNTFNTFRHALYACFQRSADVLFEITDALLTETVARSLSELSLSPFFRRLWPSLYQALQEGRLDHLELRCVLANFAVQALAGGRHLLGVDASNIARPLSPTAADRTCLHGSNLPESAGAAITYGWQFSTLMVLPDQPGSQTYILRSFAYSRDCHPERSEGSVQNSSNRTDASRSRTYVQHDKQKS